MGSARSGASLGKWGIVKMDGVVVQELSPLVWDILAVVIAFGLQMLFCFAAKRTAVRCIPLYLLAAGFLYAGATALGLFGSYSFGDISGNQLTGLFIAVFTAVAALGVLLAWLVYWLVRAVKRRRQ